MKSAFIAGLALFVTALSSARANDMGPDVFVKNEYVKIYMFMGDTLRASGALATDCLREARDWARTVEAGERSKSNAPPDVVPIYSRRYDIRSIVGNKRYVSVSWRGSSDLGDVQVSSEDAAFLWDSKNGKRIGLDGFFREAEDGGPAMTRLLSEVTSGLTAQTGKDQAALVIASLAPSFKNLGPISLAPSTAPGKSSGFTFHFALPVSGRPILQHTEIFVPWTKFERHLSPHGRTIFGGKWRERHIW